MKHIQTFGEFINESVNKSSFLKMNSIDQANSIIEDPLVMSYISGDKFAGIIADLRGDNDTIKRLVNSINLEDLKLWPLTRLAEFFPEYGPQVVDILLKGKVKEKLNLSIFFTLYNSLPNMNKLKDLPQIPKGIYVESVNWCPTLIEIFTPEICAKSTIAEGRGAIYQALRFITLPDEFVSIKDKQTYVDALSKPIKKQLDEYSQGDLGKINETFTESAFSNRFLVGKNEQKFVGKYNTNLRSNTPEGLSYFNKWATQLTF
jgi:hypothetical protein